MPDGLNKERAWALIIKERGQVNVSFSLMDKYKNCPRQAFLSLVVSRDLVQQNEVNTIGPSAVHNLFDAWVTKANYEPGWMLEHAEEYYDKKEAKARLVVYKDAVSPTIQRNWNVVHERDYQLAKVRKAVVVLEKLAGLLQFKEHGIETERWFTIQIPGQDVFFLKGAVDIYDPVTKTVYDIKITENASYGKDLQLFFYGLLRFYETGDAPVNAAYLYPLISKPIKQVVLDSAALSQASHAVREFIQKFKDVDFPVAPESQQICSWCDFKKFCPKYGGSIGLGERQWFTHPGSTAS